MNAPDFNSPAYKRSRAAYIGQSTFDYFIALLVSDAFLAKLLTSLGVSDSLSGIIASFVSLVFVFQIFSIFLVKGRLGAKTLSIVFEALSQLCFASMYLIPFLQVSRELQHTLVILAILFAYIAKYLVFSILFKWGNSFVNPKTRGSFSAKREIISLVSGIVFTLVISSVFDSLEAAGNLRGGFLFISIVMLASNLLGVICMLMMKNDKGVEEQTEKKPLGDLLKNTVGNEHFRRLLILSVIWDSARYFLVGFLGVYKTKELVMTVFIVQIINMVSNGFRVLFSVPFGKYSDKHSFAKGLELGMMLAALAFLACVFTTPKTWYLIILYSIIYNVSIAGTNQNSFNITYSYVNSEYIVQAMAIKNCVGGICGFVAALIGGRILSAVQANGNKVFGIPMYGQQFLALIAFLFAIGAVVYMHFSILRRERELKGIHED